MHFFSLLLQKKKVGFVFNYKKKDITCIFSSFFVSCNFCQFCSFSCNFSSFLSCKKKLNSLNHSPTLNWELFPLSKKKLHGSQHYRMSWPALDKVCLLQPFRVSIWESESSWPELWPLYILRRLNYLTLNSHHQGLRRREGGKTWLLELPWATQIMYQRWSIEPQSIWTFEIISNNISNNK